jgi:hypothetical protein
VKVTDPALRTAIFLHDHPGWSPDDLERADPDVVALMQSIASTVARVQSQSED